MQPVNLADDPLVQLPPLPTPDYARQYVERARGCALVLSLILIFVSATTSILQAAQLNATFTWSCCGLIWAEAVVALVCLAGIQLGDPGELKRTRETCLPIPDEVQRTINGPEPERQLTLLQGNLDGEDGRVYCVRCFLWRPAHFWNHRVHHCRTCQRCVGDFDHHCGVLGRCIAGKGCSGNMKFFIGLLLCGHAGFWTFAASCSAALVWRWGWDAFGIAFGAAFVLFVCILGPCLFIVVEVAFKGYLTARLAKLKGGGATHKQPVPSAHPRVRQDEQQGDQHT